MTIAAPENRTLRDALLIVRCQLGEVDAFDELFQKWNPPIWNYLRRHADRDDVASDLAQDVWLRVLRGIAALKDGERFRAWLFGIARHAWMDHLRVRYQSMPVSDQELESLMASDTDAEAPDDPLLERMHAELQRLPLIERDVLTLFYLKELSLSELSEVLGVPLGTVKSRLFRARQLLRNQIHAHGVSP